MVSPNQPSGIPYAVSCGQHRFACHSLPVLGQLPPISVHDGVRQLHHFTHTDDHIQCPQPATCYHRCDSVAEEKDISLPYAWCPLFHHVLPPDYCCYLLLPPGGECAD